MVKQGLRSLPSVDKLLKDAQVENLIKNYGRPLTLEAIRQVLDEARVGYRKGNPIPDQGTLVLHVDQVLVNWIAPTLRPVINTTGVIIHTNLGRSPLSQETIRAMEMAASGYSNLEYDLGKGKRGSRTTHTETLVTRLTGAEAAIVVNNNAAAVLLVLSSLANRRRVVISRTQLIEIGGSFRIPDVMRQSGAKLVEIGATNRVHLRDYEHALQEQPVALMLTAHWSNFRIVGFTSEPTQKELVGLSRQYGVTLVNDLGSGTFLNTSRYGLEHEPTVPETLAAGVDIVTFSGDKLLGGPQAEIIAGRADLVGKIKKHPLARAVRADKLCLAGLSATLSHYLKDEADEKIPIWQMISAKPETIKARAQALAGRLTRFFDESKIDLVPGESTVGGGSLPGETLPTTLIALKVKSVKRFQERLRSAGTPVIARAQDNFVLLDLRTVLPSQEETLAEGILFAAGK